MSMIAELDLTAVIFKVMQQNKIYGEITKEKLKEDRYVHQRGFEKLIANLNFLQLLQRPASITFIILNNTGQIFF